MPADARGSAADLPPPPGYPSLATGCTGALRRPPGAASLKGLLRRADTGGAHRAMSRHPPIPLPALLGLLCAVVLSGCTSDHVAPSSVAAPETGVRIGSVATDAEAETQLFAPLARYLGRRLAEAGSTHVQAEVVIAPSADAMGRLLAAGKVDIYLDSPYPVLRACALGEATPWLRRWKRGRADYTSTLSVAASGPLHSLEQLRGKVIAFEDPSSTSRYFLPASELLHRGLTLVECKPGTMTVPGDKVGYVFAGIDRECLDLLESGKVAAIALDSDDLYAATSGRDTRLRVLWRSPPVPRHVLAYRTNLDPQLRNQLERILIAMDQDREGRQVLDGFERTACFDRITTADRQVLNRLRELERQLNDRSASAAPR